MDRDFDGGEMRHLDGVGEWLFAVMMLLVLRRDCSVNVIVVGSVWEYGTRLIREEGQRQLMFVDDGSLLYFVSFF